jgi:GT2 family glycosyltransferase
LKISVIICTKNRLDDFRKTVTSLAGQKRLPDELIVVDSSDGPIVQDYISALPVPFQREYYRAPLGLTRARNVGVQRSNGDLLFFFDDDVELDTSYLARVEEVFKSDVRAEIGAVGGRIRNFFSGKRVTGWLFLKRRIFDFLRSVFLLSRPGNGMFRYSGMPSQPHALETSRYIECLSGGCMAFRREVFEHIRFDEDLIGYGHVEDADISKQILNAGFKIYYEASATLDHYPSPQDRPATRNLAKLTVVNYAHYFRGRWPQTTLRKMAFWWALMGLCFMFLRGAGWLGVLSGIREILRADQMRVLPSENAHIDPAK